MVGNVVVLAILDEPPFSWLDADTVTGPDVEVARRALSAAALTQRSWSRRPRLREHQLAE
jgi:ABC-type amino acid transport substrate-binding protein